MSRLSGIRALAPSWCMRTPRIAQCTNFQGQRRPELIDFKYGWRLMSPTIELWLLKYVCQVAIFLSSSSTIVVSRGS
ncbi:hypothetical protein EX30DRAFT_185999 [Ascodesmis nigricans]|uniref:Uncharacterized protein n=1 Tax=Ascodesmis nigricans TaxID=341454 RepID=A0A4V3SJ31_9PEZI|nr:hypothetical protein EX30DRAFT_185999 [Ascodesmis nigricans]